MISVQSLRVDYENVTAVCDLNLEVAAGQIYGLVGPNGAGKTSMIKAIAGILEPTYGEIKIAGYDLDLNPQEALRHLGFMPDFPPVYEHLKVWEYLDVFAASYLIQPSDRLSRARHWVERVNLKEKWDAYIRDLSRGMRQRLILAKILLADPDVLLMDEPASGLDPIARLEMRDILKEIAAAGKTIIISSHILTELSDFCNAIGIMEKGKMVVSGTLEEIRRHIGTNKELIIRLANTSHISDEQRRSFLTVLGESSFIADLKEIKPGEFRALFSGEQEDAVYVLSQLVKKDFPILEFQIKEADVEDIFFKVGAKEVS